MIENAVKKYFKDNVYIVKGYGLELTYKINVNIKPIKTVSGATIKHIDLNVKIVKCTSVYHYNTTGNIFDVCRRNKYVYNDVRMVIREDLNKWFGTIFSTCFYKSCTTRLCEGVEIGLNKFTYK
jgi:UTP-glucose-1-phosphate uridylyltransferase